MDATVIIIDTKSFQIRETLVTVVRQHQPSDSKPHQVQISAEIDGITKAETWSYSSTGNPDCDFAYYDEGKASNFVSSFRRFLESVKGQKLANDGAEPQEGGKQQ